MNAAPGRARAAFIVAEMASRAAAIWLVIYSIGDPRLSLRPMWPVGYLAVVCYALSRWFARKAGRTPLCTEALNVAGYCALSLIFLYIANIPVK